MTSQIGLGPNMVNWLYWCVSSVSISIIIISTPIEPFKMHRGSLLHCSYQSLPIKYLGLLIGGSPKRAKFWDPIIDKIMKRLAI